MGSPTYIVCHNVNGRKSCTEIEFGKDKIDILAYSLVYEYDDHMITIGVMESVMVNKNNKARNEVELTGVCYYPKECWEGLKKIYPQFPGTPREGVHEDKIISREDNN